MPPPPPAPNRYHSTRLAHRDETAEDYVEAIAQLTALHGQARVKHLAALTETLIWSQSQHANPHRLRPAPRHAQRVQHR